MSMAQYRLLNIITIIVGFCTVAVYITFAAIAYALYPSSFSPVDNWLSDLGRYTVNTSGAIFYNAGCIITASLIVAFAICLRLPGLAKKWQNVFVVISKISLVFAGFSLVFAAIFSIDQADIHSAWSAGIVFGLVYFLTFLGISLIPIRGFPRIAGIFGIAIGSLNMVYGLVTNTPLMEWIAIFTSLGFYVMVTCVLIPRESSKD